MEILTKRNILVEKDGIEENYEYLNMYLLSNFGIVVDRPKKLNKTHLEEIEKVFNLNIPKSFYKNPQDMKYYTCSELFTTQMLSYFCVEVLNLYPTNEEINIFEKELPNYVKGNELVLRKFKIISKEEAEEELRKIANAYCSYTRPFGYDESDEFLWLYQNGYVSPDASIKGRDNLFNLLYKDITLAKYLDKKDIVKFSINRFGERKTDLRKAMNSSEYSKSDCEIIKNALPLLMDCKLTKKQAKYYNKLVQIFEEGEYSEHNSPYREAIATIKANDTIGAAKIFAKNGSMLERNLKMLLARADKDETEIILNMVKDKNPIVLYQLINKLCNNGKRTFKFVKHNLLISHLETDYEYFWSKSKLDKNKADLVKKICKEKIFNHYKNNVNLGKIYIDDVFAKVALPINTSNTGKGIDVLPTGSRIKINKDYIRTHVRWNGISDVDASLVIISSDSENLQNDLDYYYLNFASYTEKKFGNSILFSGDNRNSNGSEFYDINLAEMKKKGIHYIVQMLKGYGSEFNQGKTFCGWQEKDDINTEAWDPKNITSEFRIFGDSRECMGFAIDLDTMEIIILNQMSASYDAVGSNITNIIDSLRPIEISMKDILGCCGEVVSDPNEANIVFSNDYEVTEKQERIRAYDIEKLISILNS